RCLSDWSSDVCSSDLIPCCVDFETRFTADVEALRKDTRNRLGINGRRVLTHVGALGGLYLTKELAALMAAARRHDPRTFAMFLRSEERRVGREGGSLW